MSVSVLINAVPSHLQPSLLRIAQRYPGLRKVALGKVFPDELLVDFCALCPCVEELRLVERFMENYNPESVRQAVLFLPRKLP